MKVGEEGSSVMVSDEDHLLPVGFRFMPTDEELITHYLMNKANYKPVAAAGAIQDIDATNFYSNHPKSLVTYSCGEREWFFFIHEDENCSSTESERRRIRVVGNGVGFWKPNGSENPIYDDKGNVFAFKIFLTYFSGTLPKPKRTHWKMIEYRLHFDYHTAGDKENPKRSREWVLGRMKRGMDY